MERSEMKVFAKNASIDEFGSRYLNQAIDPEDKQGTPADKLLNSVDINTELWQYGFRLAEPVYGREFNALWFWLTTKVNDILCNDTTSLWVPNANDGRGYDLGSTCYIIESNIKKTYISTIANNLTDPSTITTDWLRIKELEAGDAINIDTDNKINVKVDNTTVKINGNNELYIEGGGGTARNIGEIVQSTLPQDDATLHLLNGDLIVAGGSYNAFYLYIKGIFDSGLYDNLFVTETDWQTSVTSYGVCGKFVFTDGVSVRLPKIFKFTEGTITTADLGNLTTAGLPDHNHTVTITNMGIDNNFGNWVDQSAAGGTIGPTFTTTNASNSNPIYGNSTTVQPQSIKVLYYICIATAVKTDIVIDIDNIMTDLSALQHGTTAIFDTLDNTAKQNLAKLFEPDLTAGVAFTSGSVTSSNGWIKSASNTLANSAAQLLFNGVVVVANSISGSGGMGRVDYIFVAKGVTVTYSNMSSVIFYPCKSTY